MRLIAGLQRVREQLEGPLNTMPMLVGPSRKGFLGKLTGEGLLMQAGFMTRLCSGCGTGRPLTGTDHVLKVYKMIRRA